MFVFVFSLCSALAFVMSYRNEDKCTHTHKHVISQKTYKLWYENEPNRGTRKTNTALLECLWGLVNVHPPRGLKSLIKDGTCEHQQVAHKSSCALPRNAEMM